MDGVFPSIVQATVRPNLEHNLEDPHQQQVLAALWEVELEFATQAAAFWTPRKRNIPSAEDADSQLVGERDLFF